MKKFILMIACSLYCICSVVGQTTNSEISKQINAIKMNQDYISSESTAETWETAYDNARALLEVNIEEWIKATDASADLQGFIAKSSNNILELKTMRGSRYRAFLYVKKSDIMTFKNSKNIIVAPIQQEDKQNAIAITPQEDNAPASVPQEMYQPSDEEQRMLQVVSSSQIEPFIKGNNKVQDYGKYKDVPDTGECYFFVYNREGGISAYLLRNEKGYVNVKTGESDNIDNYKGCGAIWFRYNK